MATNTNRSPTDETSHIDQSIPLEWRAVDCVDETLIVHDVPEGRPECYRIQRTTRNARALAHSRVDAVLYEGTVVEPIYDAATRRVLLQHTFAGTKARLPTEEWLTEPVVVLERCDHVDLGDRLADVTGGRDV